MAITSFIHAWLDLICIFVSFQLCRFCQKPPTQSEETNSSMYVSSISSTENFHFLHLAAPYYNMKNGVKKLSRNFYVECYIFSLWSLNCFFFTSNSNLGSPTYLHSLFSNESSTATFSLHFTVPLIGFLVTFSSLLSIEIIILTAFISVKCFRSDVHFLLTSERYTWLFNMWETFVILTVAATTLMEKHWSDSFVSFIWFSFHYLLLTHTFSWY